MRRICRALSVPARQAAGPAASSNAALLRVGAPEGAAIIARRSMRFFAENGDKPWSTPRAPSPTSTGDGGRLFTMGNGGSSCDAAHVAVEFLHPVTAGRPALTAINLDRRSHDDDRGRQRRRLRSTSSCASSSRRRTAGDGLIGISTSGNSANLRRRLSDKAKEMGVTTIGLAGMSGGEMAKIGSRSLPGGRNRQHPSHPGMPRHHLSHSLGPGAHAAGGRSRHSQRAMPLRRTGKQTA